jgi:glycosyltransferase involved in cell wall biosynthesis
MMRLLSRWKEYRRKRTVVEVTPRPAHTLPDEPLVSIVTVVRNDAPGLSHTLRSVFTQTRQDFEYLVIDGASTDRTMEVVRSNAAGIDRRVSEPDRGPYDAMAKGARMAHGRFVLFMNAGDEFVGPSALEEALRDAPADADILYGHHLYLRRNGLCLPRPAADLNDTYARLRKGHLSVEWMAGIPCHQSTFIARRWLLEPGFDLGFRVAADHALLFGLMARGCKAHHTGSYVARYAAGGMSRQHLDVCYADWERIALQHAREAEPVRAFYAAMRRPRGIRRWIRFGKRP